MHNFPKALHWAVSLHKDQVRKSTQIPYISHLMAVSGLVLEAVEQTPFTDNRIDLAIAALLHDAIEDCGDRVTLTDIKREFGGLVAEIVADCSDSCGSIKKPWKERKEVYIAKIGSKRRESQLVSCADKLHNARCIVSDYERIGSEIWKRFNASPDNIIWYYKSLCEEFGKSWPDNPLLLPLYSFVKILTRTQA